MNQLESDGTQKIVAITKVTIPKDDGPIEGTSTIEAIPNSMLYDHFENIGIAKQKPYLNLHCQNIVAANEDDNQKGKTESEKSASSMGTQCTLTTIKENDCPAPSAPPLHDITNDDPKPMYNFQRRPHEYTNRTVLRSESCAYCLKK